ncbi:MAG: PVC-type heme-binding CxxCH protein, partial [Opitutales bacterium]
VHRQALACGILVLLLPLAEGAITKPADAPKPYSPEDSVKLVALPPGFRLELLAAEPVVRQPSGVCRDAQGRLFVCELHGYNLEGQYDVEALNKTGKLDRVVRRIAAPPEAVRKAEKDQHGVVKLLRDLDGDGRMDEAVVWADDLPPCLGIVPARDGVIVTAEPDIIFLADRDGDGRAEIRETLFTGFKVSMLERRINQPRWGPDDWIYAGRGRGGRITGLRLAEPVQLPGSDFRFKPDGSAIEPVTGGTSTIGWTFTGTGQRFVATTVTPGNYVAPIPWRYLERNPRASLRGVQTRAGDYQNIHQLSKPHPWRFKREKDPGFFNYYKTRYGEAESIASGYFTSACSPLVYRDEALPGLQGSYLVCEPSTNVVHRAVIKKDGTFLKLERPESESKREFLASSDVWFHPISLAPEPDGAIVIVDFYREIIEDYSAIPRYLQQQYRLDTGKDHGRIWRLVHKDMPKSPNPDMSKLGASALAKETGSPYHWRRQTARRLLVEKATLSPEAIGALNELATNASGKREAVVNALHTLTGLGKLSPPTLLAGLTHVDFGVRVHALRLSEPWLDRSTKVLEKVVSMIKDDEPLVLIQLALTLGESDSKKAVQTLKTLAKEHGGLRWMNTAIQSSQGAGKDGSDDTLAQDLGSLKEAAEKLATGKPVLSDKQFAQTYDRYVKALGGKRDPKRGAQLFQKTCAACHRVRGIGKAVGPDLTGERNRAEETMVLDVLAPNREITAGYATHLVRTNDGASLAGLLVAEAPGNVTLRDLTGNEQVILRKNLAEMEALKASLMPPGLEQVLSPKDLADLIAWLRQ